MKKILLTGLLLGLAVVSHATVLTFDDLPAPSTIDGVYSPVPTGYGGFNWNNAVASNFVAGEGAMYYNKNTSPNGGYPAGVTSGNQAMLSWWAQDIVLSGPVFDFNSVNISAAWSTHSVDVYGYLGSTLLYSSSVVAWYGAPQNVVFNYLGIDKLVFRANNNHIIIDDLEVNAVQSVPDAFSVLGGFAVVMAAMVGLRRRLVA